jgi:hypothetical protein
MLVAGVRVKCTARATLLKRRNRVEQEESMRLNSVRELKQSLPTHLERTFATRAAVGATASTAVASAASLHRTAPSYFLGVSAKSKTDYRLAVRLQDHALEKSELVQEITTRAKGC